jgi:hypothetical protein
MGNGSSLTRRLSVRFNSSCVKDFHVWNFNISCAGDGGSDNNHSFRLGNGKWKFSVKPTLDVIEFCINVSVGWIVCFLKQLLISEKPEFDYTHGKRSMFIVLALFDPQRRTNQ